MTKRKEPTNTEVLVSNIESMRTGVGDETCPGLYVGMNVKLGDSSAACDLVVGAAQVMGVREAIGFLSHLITDGRADLLKLAREYESAKLRAETKAAVQAILR